MKRTRHVMERATAGSVMEGLESRRFLSATLENGILVVRGTSDNDRITIGTGNDDGTVFARVNGTSEIFDRAAVREIRVECGDGNDAFWFDNHPGFLLVPVIVDGGRGDDHINGQDGRDYLDRPLPGSYAGMHATLLGGEGNDVLNAGVGADYIDGGGGDDTLEAIFGGTSTLHGGSGDDELVAYGRAFVYGDDGDDRLTIGPENVTIAEGGEGYDSVYVYDWQTDQITLRSAETPVQDAAEPLRPERSAAKPGTTTDVDVPTIVANQATVPPPFSTAAAPLAAGSVFGDHADDVWDALG